MPRLHGDSVDDYQPHSVGDHRGEYHPDQSDEARYLGSPIEIINRGVCPDMDLSLLAMLKICYLGLMENSLA